MAIAPIKKTNKIEWTRGTIIEISIAGVIVLVSVFVGYHAFARWRFKTHFVEGLEYYDSNQSGAAKTALEEALSWDPDDVGSRELIAKILCDGGSLDAAEKHYQHLLVTGQKRPEARVGLGVIALKRADQAGKAEDAAAQVKKAREEFGRAGGPPEAAIGLGHCDLFEAWRMKDAKKLEEARGRFEKIRDSVKNSAPYRKACTRDGLIDFYAGLGKVLSAAGKAESAAAVAAFRSSYVYAPKKNPLPLANILLLEAQHFAEGSFSNEALLKLKPDTATLRRETENLWKGNRVGMASLREPWLLYSVMLARAYARAGNMIECDQIIHDLIRGSGFEQRVEPPLYAAMIRTERAIRPDMDPQEVKTHVQFALENYAELLKRPGLNDEERKPVRALALNGLAWMQAWMGSFESAPNLFSQARENLEKALKLYPGDYLFSRNLVVVLKRMKAPEAAIQKALEGAKASSVGEWAEDYSGLEKHAGGN